MIQADDRQLDSIRIGEEASFERIISNEDVQAFADISGDYNPLHMDDEYASTTEFGRRIVHGMFLGALVSRLIGMHLPGRRALLMEESIEFKKPVHIGDTVKIEGAVMNASRSTGVMELSFKIHAGEILIASGRANILVRDK